MKWLLRVKLTRISTMAIISCLVLLVSFAGYTIYGTQVGNWVVSVEDPSIQLVLSTHEDIESYGTTRLTVPGLDDQDNSTYEDIPDEITDGLGSKNDSYRHRYLAYSFYVMNAGSTAVDVEMSFDVTGVRGSALSAARFLLIEGNGLKQSGTVYAMPEASDAARTHLYEQLLEHGGYYPTADFLSSEVIFSRTITDFAPSQRVKYTIVLWYEGCDIDCTDDILGSSIRLELSFVGI